MRKLAYLLLSLFSLTIAATAFAHGHGFSHHDGRYYDHAGRYEGRIDNGRIYDQSGRYQGRIDANGRQYDSSGR